MCLTRDILTLAILISRVSCDVTTYRPIPDTSRICLATYEGWFDNKFLLGTWYNVYFFTTRANLPGSTECREILFRRPSQKELMLYKTTYNSTGMPYSFEEDSILYSDVRKVLYTGLLIGRREAKFFLRNPPVRSIYRERYDVIVLRHINENFIVYEECNMRGDKWLMSKIKYPSDDDLQTIINSQRDLKELENQKYCTPFTDPND